MLYICYLKSQISNLKSNMRNIKMPDTIPNTGNTPRLSVFCLLTPDS